MNISDPVAAVTMKAAHVHFSMSEAICRNDLRVEASPSNRKSMIAMVPKTIANPNTCVASIRGKKYSELRILVATPDDSSDARKVGKSIGSSYLKIMDSLGVSGFLCRGPGSPDMIISDEAAKNNDDHPDQERQYRKPFD